jgi:hypothetical protein
MIVDAQFESNSVLEVEHESGSQEDD